MHAPFVILAQPRSRTAWLSTWLTHGDRRCHHDALATAHSRDALRRLTAGGNGLAETAGMAIPRVLFDTLPGARYLIVWREPAQVVESLERLGAGASRAAVQAGALELDRAARYLKERAPLLQMWFDDLDDPDRLDAVWRFLRPGDHHDQARTRALSGMRITKLNPFAGFPPTRLLEDERRLAGQRQ